MKMLNLFALFSLLLLLSCGEKESRDAEMEDMTAVPQEFQDPDEAIENWAAAWNSNEPERIQSLTAPDVVVVIDGYEMPKDSIDSFIESGSVMKDLVMRSLKKGSTDNIAYDTGTYSHTYTTDTTQYKGSYTFIWERANDENEWKVKAINISNLQPE